MENQTPQTQSTQKETTQKERTLLGVPLSAWFFALIIAGMVSVPILVSNSTTISSLRRIEYRLDLLTVTPLPVPTIAEESTPTPTAVSTNKPNTKKPTATPQPTVQ